MKKLLKALRDHFVIVLAWTQIFGIIGALSIGFMIGTPQGFLIGYVIGIIIGLGGLGLS